MSAAQATQTRSFDTGSTLLGPGTVFEGLLTFRGSARVDGELTGEVRSQGRLVLGGSAQLRGTIDVGELVLAGRIEGDVIVRERAVLESGAVLIGTLVAPLLRIDDGARLEGPCRSGVDAFARLAREAAGAPASARPEAPTPSSGSAEAAENAPESA